MFLELAILGFLKKGSKTGYELQKKIEKSINYFWTSTQSQIYRTLKKMEKDALIDFEIHYQDEKPNKKVYTITNKGRNELNKLLSSPIDVPNHRNPFLVQLFFSESVDKKTIKCNLNHYKRVMEQRLNFLKSDEAKQMVEFAKSKTEYFIYQSIRNNGMRMLQSEIDWIDITLRELEVL